MSKIIGEHKLQAVTFTPAKLEETRGGFKVLGFIEGQHFEPNGYSRNGGRFYSESLWSKQLTENAEVRRMLEDRSMFGTIGHDLNITEKELREGLVSHITTSMALEQNGIRGYAKSEILDTPAGRALKAYQEAGTQLYASSRADGTYAEGKVKHPNGKEVPALDEDTYQLERFDYVIKPGFLSANPRYHEKLIESLDEDALEFHNSLLAEAKEETPNDSDVDNEDPKNDKVQNDSDDVDDVKFDKDADSNKSDTKDKDENMKPEKKEGNVGQLETLLTEIESLKVENEALTTEKNEAIASKINEEDLTFLESAKAFVKEHGSFDAILEVLTRSKAFFEEVGTPADIREAFTKVQAYHEEFGSPVEMVESLEDVVSYFEAHGNPEDVVEALEHSTAFFEKCGDPKTIETALSYMKTFIESHGSKEELEEKLKTLSTFVETHGALEEVEKKFEVADILKSENEVLRLAKHLGVNASEIQELKAEGLNAKQITEYYRRTRKSAADTVVFDLKESKETVIAESKQESKTIVESKTRLGRVFG